MTRYFFDADIAWQNGAIDLISVGIATDDGREYYAINYDCNYETTTSVIGFSHLPQKPVSKFFLDFEIFKQSGEYAAGWRNRSSICVEVQNFVEAGEETREWIHCLDREDAFRSTALLYSEGTLSFKNTKTIDIRDIAKEKNNPSLISRSLPGEHHNLNVARWIKKTWELLNAPSN